MRRDFQHYQIGDRQQIEINFSDPMAFLTNQAVWRYVIRVGGPPWMKNYVTLADASTRRGKDKNRLTQRRKRKPRKKQNCQKENIT